MDKLKLFLEIPDLNIKDARELYSISEFIKNKNARQILGYNKIYSCFTNDNLKKCNILELIDACEIIEASVLKEVFVETNERNIPKIVTTNTKECFICDRPIKYYSALNSRLYDDYSGKIFMKICLFEVNYD